MFLASTSVCGYMCVVYRCVCVTCLSVCVGTLVCVCTPRPDIFTLFDAERRHEVHGYGECVCVCVSECVCMSVTYVNR